ncbi:MAG: hypothetical protein NZ522_08990, partial [Chitinophagales bacterium]|nr:hypothetical protein [Chitinophagales bacterium]
MRLFCFCILVIIYAANSAVHAQFNIHELGRKQVYFGIAVGLNASNFTVLRKPKLPENDTIYYVRPRLGPGFNLGIICNYQFHRYFDLRFIPTLSFSDKILE